MRVDARTSFAPDYVDRCVAALERSGAAIVGGQMRYEADNARRARHRSGDDLSPWGRPSRLSARGGQPRFVDTVYLAHVPSQHDPGGGRL